MSTLVHRLGNGAWQIGRNEALVREVAEDADWLDFIEMRDAGNDPVPVGDILGPEWDVRQNLRTGALAGSVTAVRRDSDLEIHHSELTQISPSGRGVQARYRRENVLSWRGHPISAAVQHNPVPSTGLQRVATGSADRWVADAKRWRKGHPHRLWVIAGDFNDDPQAVKRALGAPNVHGVKPMAFLWSNGWDITSQRARRGLTGTDHAVLTLTAQDTHRKEKP